MRGEISKSVGIDFDFGRFSIFITISITVAGSSRLEQWGKKGQIFFLRFWLLGHMKSF